MYHQTALGAWFSTVFVARGTTARQACRSSGIKAKFNPAPSAKALGYSGASPYQTSAYPGALSCRTSTYSGPRPTPNAGLVMSLPLANVYLCGRVALEVRIRWELIPTGARF